MDQYRAQALLEADHRIQRGDNLLEPVYTPPVALLGFRRVLRRHPLTGGIEVDRRAVYRYRGVQYTEARLPSIVEMLGNMTAAKQREIEGLMDAQTMSADSAGPAPELRQAVVKGRVRVIRSKK